MARKKNDHGKNPKPTPVESIRHKDKRKNIPTEVLRDFVAQDEHAPKTMLYPGDPSLDPQHVWKGKNRIGLNGDRFSMEQVLPLHDSLNDSEVPSYQVYLSLAWLRKEGILVQHERQGYSLPNETDIAAVVEERWQQLASR